MLHPRGGLCVVFLWGRDVQPTGSLATWDAPHAVLVRHVKITTSSVSEFATLIGLAGLHGDLKFGFETRKIDTLTVEGVDIFLETDPVDKDVTNHAFISHLKSETARKSALKRELQLAWREKWTAEDGSAGEDEGSHHYDPRTCFFAHPLRLPNLVDTVGHLLRVR